MKHEYIDSTEEYVKISRKNYDGIKDGYDAGYKHASDETLEVIEDLEDRNEKLISGLEFKELREKTEIRIQDFKVWVNRIEKRESDLYDRITKFQSSLIGKLLNFFGVKL